MPNSTKQPIIIATPHRRYDALVTQLVERLGGRPVIRILLPQELQLDKLEKMKPEYIFFPHWSWVIPREIHERFVCVIFHMTDLPYGRGGSPLQNLIVRGHKETKLSALKCQSGLDTGPIYLKRPLSLAGTAEEIFGRATGLMEDMIVEIVQAAPTPMRQEGSVVEFKRRRPEDGNISDLESLQQVYDYIRMLDADGYPSAFIDTRHMLLEFTEARITEEYVEAKVRIRRKRD